MFWGRGLSQSETSEQLHPLLEDETNKVVERLYGCYTQMISEMASNKNAAMSGHKKKRGIEDVFGDDIDDYEYDTKRTSRLKLPYEDYDEKLREIKTDLTPTQQREFEEKAMREINRLRAKVQKEEDKRRSKGSIGKEGAQQFLNEAMGYRWENEIILFYQDLYPNYMGYDHPHAMGGLNIPAQPDLEGFHSGAIGWTEGMLNGEAQPTFNVTPGVYRLRIINGGGLFAYLFSIDNHVITVVAADGSETDPYETDIVQVATGERFDVMVNFTTVGAHWVRAMTPSRAQEKGILGVFRVLPLETYNNGDSTPLTPQYSNPWSIETSRILNYVGHEDTTYNATSVAEALRSSVKPPILTEEEEPIIHIVDFMFQFIPQYAHLWSINGANWTQHVQPYTAMIQPDFNPETDLHPHALILPVPLNKTVVFVIRSVTAFPHPVHMHGHKFEVLEVAPRVRAECPEGRCDLEPLESLFSEPISELAASMGRKVFKDTVIVPTGGGVAIRIRTDNPGVWFFHCHLDQHMEDGQGFVIQAGNPTDYNPSHTPPDIPSCDYTGRVQHLQYAACNCYANPEQSERVNMRESKRKIFKLERPEKAEEVGPSQQVNPYFDPRMVSKAPSRTVRPMKFNDREGYRWENEIILFYQDLYPNYMGYDHPHAMGGLNIPAQPDLEGFHSGAIGWTEGMLNGEAQPTFNVTPGVYRLRIINGGGLFAYLFSIDNHVITVVAADGSETDPYETDIVQVATGERFDVMVNFTTVGAHWVRAMTPSRAQEKGILGVFRVLPLETYNNGDSTPLTPQYSNPWSIETSRILNYVGHEDTTYNATSVAEALRSSVKSPIVAEEEAEEPIIHIVDFMFQFIPQYAHLWSINGANWTQHVQPYTAMIQPDFNPETDLHPHALILPVPLNKTVVFVIRSVTAFPHPVHMHGHKFEVLEVAPRVRAECPEGRCDLEPLESLFSEPISELAASVGRKVFKDTVIVPAGGGVAIRIRTDNPGVWFFHCHLDQHMEDGQGFVIQAGNPTDYNPSHTPPDIPSCDYTGRVQHLQYAACYCYANPEQSERVNMRESKRKIFKLERPEKAEEVGPSQQVNPYFDPRMVSKAPSRTVRPMKFNDPGKYVVMAQKMRAQTKLHDLQKKIADTAKRTGISTVARRIMLTDESLAKEDPVPTIEWWDKFILVSEEYSESPLTELEILGSSEHPKYREITHLIEHPVSKPPPGCPTVFASPVILGVVSRYQLRLSIEKSSCSYSHNATKTKSKGKNHCIKMDLGRFQSCSLFGACSSKFQVILPTCWGCQSCNQNVRLTVLYNTVFGLNNLAYFLMSYDQFNGARS
eukprot:sb/3461048/